MSKTVRRGGRTPYRCPGCAAPMRLLNAGRGRVSAAGLQIARRQCDDCSLRVATVESGSVVALVRLMVLAMDAREGRPVGELEPVVEELLEAALAIVDGPRV